MSFLEHVENLCQIGTWELDLEANTLKWSDAVYTILGYSPQEFQSSLEKLIELTHPDDRNQYENHLQDALETGISYQIQTRILAKDGSFRYIRSKANVEFNSEKTAVKLVGVYQDITEFVEAQLTLQAKESSLSTLINSGPECVKILAPDGVLLDMNPAGLKIIEATEGRNSVIGKNLLHLIHQDDRAIFEHMHRQALQGQIGEANYRIVGLNGTEKFLEGTSVPIRNKQGSIVSVLCLTRDVSEKTRLAETIQRNEKRFRALVENSANAIAIIRPEGSISYVSPSIRNVLGYSEAEGLQLNLMEIVHPDDAEKVGQKVAEALQNPGIPIEGHPSRVKHKDGSWRWLAATITNLLDDPAINGIVDNFRDITETKELEILLDNASHLAQVGGWKIDLVRNTQYWSAITRKIYEVPDDFTPSQSKSLEFYQLPYREIVTQEINLAIKEKRSFQFEVPLITAKGNEKWIRAIGQPEFMGDQCVSIFGSIQDIHTRKTLELALEKNIKDLAVSNQELEQFAFIASHDLQEPLRMVDSFLTLLAKRYEDQLDEKAHQYIHFATDGARRMRQVILALLDFSRVGKNQDKLTAIDLNELLNEIMALKRRLIQEKGVVIQFSNLPIVRSYRAPLLQIFQNLVGNAIKYSKEDQAPVINIQALEHLNEWEIIVQDNGIGISHEYYDKIFILFQRLHKKSQYSGTGIGLAIVKKIVESLGGRIWLESEEGIGSRFHFTFKKVAGT